VVSDLVYHLIFGDAYQPGFPFFLARAMKLTDILGDAKQGFLHNV
jgi:hypothetical protein